MNALPEFWAAVLGWLDLIARRKDVAGKFNLSRAGLINATGAYVAIALLGAAVMALLGLDPGLIGSAVRLALNLLSLLSVWVAIGATRLALPAARPAYRLLVPATYAMALLLLVRIPLDIAAPGLFTNALLGALCFMLYRGARAVAGLGIGSSLAFAVLSAVLLVLVTVGIYMLATGGAGIG
jgi:hypothetical protein